MDSIKPFDIQYEQTCYLIGRFGESVHVDLFLTKDALIILKHDVKDSIRYTEYVMIIILSFIIPSIVYELIDGGNAFSLPFITTFSIIIFALFLIFLFFGVINPYLIERRNYGVVGEITTQEEKVKEGAIIIDLKEISSIINKNNDATIKDDNGNYVIRGISSYLLRELHRLCNLSEE
ncbi:MAG: hypothetical protein SVM80_05500 [Halobacteriota archaeon]|nr:hypothetical protein [Halobacteriota archaeon]